MPDPGTLTDEQTFIQAYLGNLVGWTVDRLILNVDTDGDEEPTWGLVLRHPDRPIAKTIAWIMSDSEGNGPGWLDLEETY